VLHVLLFHPAYVPCPRVVFPVEVLITHWQCAAIPCG
jgi:hypothetical protein